MRKLFAIDPGNTESGYVLIDLDTMNPIQFGKIENNRLLEVLKQEIVNSLQNDDSLEYAIEMVASYGMAVGKSVFETCVWIGRFKQYIEDNDCNPIIEYVYRSEEKMMICGNMKAKDSNIRQALIDEFATHDFKNGKGTKKQPDFFYGFSKDMWQAFAVGYTYVKRMKE